MGDDTSVFSHPRGSLDMRMSPDAKQNEDRTKEKDKEADNEKVDAGMQKRQT